MESKDPPENQSAFRVRSKVPSLSISSNIRHNNTEDYSIIADSSSSSPSASMSPKTPADNVSLSAEAPPDTPNIDSETKDPASGPQRTRSTSSASTSAPTRKSGDSREKRKRSRVTPEQLTHLERFFAADRSPTAARRREIAELLGMQERQTQIWFQNRRAKAKLLDGKKSRQPGGNWSDTPPDTPPQLSAGFEADLHSLIHEDQPVSIIPCTDLSIGTWRRIATGKHDLVAYVCEPKRCLTWFIHSAGYGFKMEIPFSAITHTDFRSAGPGEGLASFTLSQPPTFYLENIAPAQPGSVLGTVTRTWKKCSDWTEGTQASQVLRHDLIGSAVQLAHVLSDLQDYRTRSSIPLTDPSASFHTTGSEFRVPGSASATTLQIPQPPLTSLQTEAFPHLQRPAFLGHSRKRSSSGPPALSLDVPLHRAHEFSPIGAGAEQSVAPPFSASYVSTSFDRSVPMAPFSFGQRPVSDLIASDTSSAHIQPSAQAVSISDYSNVPISHGASHRPFVAGPSAHYFPPNRDSPPFGMNPTSSQRLAPLSSQTYVTPSPPEAPSPYTSSLGQPRALSAEDTRSSLPMGLPGVPLYHQEDLHGREALTSSGHPDTHPLAGTYGSSTSTSLPDTTPRPPL